MTRFDFCHMRLTYPRVPFWQQRLLKAAPGAETIQTALAGSPGGHPDSPAPERVGLGPNVAGHDRACAPPRDQVTDFSRWYRTGYLPCECDAAPRAGPELSLHWPLDAGCNRPGGTRHRRPGVLPLADRRGDLGGRTFAEKWNFHFRLANAGEAESNDEVSVLIRTYSRGASVKNSFRSAYASALR